MVFAVARPCGEARQTFPAFFSPSSSPFFSNPFSSAPLSSSLLNFITNRHDISIVCSAQVEPSPVPAKGCYDSSRMEVSHTHLEKSTFQGRHDNEDPAESMHLTYEVREGDTLTWIASRFGTSVQSISFLNEIADVDYVPAGKLLLIPTESNRPGEVIEGTGHLDTGHHPRFVDSHGSVDKNVVVLIESCPPPLPMHAMRLSFQSFHVKLAMAVFLLWAASGIIKRCISHFQKRKYEEVLTFQEEKGVEPYYRRKFRRWQGILDDDRRTEEAEEEAIADGRTLEDLEEEKLRQEYAELQSVYIKFLADSGLTKSGYWRGGVPPTVEEH